MIETAILVSLLPQQDWFLPKYILNGNSVVLNEDVLLHFSPYKNSKNSDKYSGFIIEYAELISGKICAVMNYTSHNEGWYSPITPYYFTESNDGTYPSLEHAEQHLLVDLYEELITRSDKIAGACVKFIKNHLKEKYNLCQVEQTQLRS